MVCYEQRSVPVNTDRDNDLYRVRGVYKTINASLGPASSSYGYGVRRLRLRFLNDVGPAAANRFLGILHFGSITSSYQNYKIL